MPRPSLRAIYDNPRMAALIAIGFSAGVPYMLTSRTMKLWARDEGVDLATIGLFSLVTLPASLKFFWAPFMDRFVPPLLGRRRGWLVITQFCLMASIVAMGLAGPSAPDSPIFSFGILALCVSFFAASQDIVADAYRTDVLKPEEYGAGASFYVSGYRVALLATGAGAVFLAAKTNWSVVYTLCAALVMIGVIATLLAPNPADDAPPATFTDAVVEPVREFVARNLWWAPAIVLFIVLFKIPDYMAAALADLLMLDLGFTKEQIALWSLGVGTAATIPGVIIGGVIASKMGLARSLIVFGVAQAVSNAGYLVLAYVGAIEWVMFLVVGIEYFCAGLVAAGFVAFLMSQCNHRFTATQYALLSSLMGLSASLAGAPTGFIAERVGYVGFFSYSIAAAIPGMALLIPLARHLERSQKKDSRNQF